jgi:hypothetical protein
MRHIYLTVLDLWRLWLDEQKRSSACVRWRLNEVALTTAPTERRESWTLAFPALIKLHGRICRTATWWVIESSTHGRRSAPASFPPERSAEKTIEPRPAGLVKDAVGGTLRRRRKCKHRSPLESGLRRQRLEVLLSALEFSPPDLIWKRNGTGFFLKRHWGLRVSSPLAVHNLDRLLE